MNINLNVDKAVFSPLFYPILFDYSHRFEVYKGSSGSGKSWFITTKIFFKALNQKRRVLVCRRYATTLQQTVYETFKQVIASFKMTQYCQFKVSPYQITLPNGSEILFSGLDEETKLLSLANISDVFIEEVFEVTQDLVEQLNLRMRGSAENQQIYMAFNPISKNSWLYSWLEVNPPRDLLYTQSTYKDNPFLNKKNREAIEELKTRNPAKYKIFGLGEWGVNPEGLVFHNWKIENFDVADIASRGYEHRCGSDLGWVDKTSIIDSFYDKENRTIYVCNEFYKSGCQLSEIVQAIYNMGLQKSKIYFDSAEPRSIDYFKKQGIIAYGSIKGKDSIKLGYQFLQDNQIIVHPKCKNLINELENFSYIKSKQTGEYTDDTTHEYSHAIDGLRYGYSDIYTNKKLGTLSKEFLGL